MEQPFEVPQNSLVGVDLVRIDRIRRAVEKRGRVFLERIWTEHELAYCRQGAGWNYASLAARYAAKEAVAKALGCGLWGRGGVDFPEIEVYRKLVGQTAAESDKADREFPRYQGPALIRLSGRALELFNELAGKACSLSLTHDGEYAMAFCIIEVKHTERNNKRETAK